MENDQRGFFQKAPLDSPKTFKNYYQIPNIFEDFRKSRNSFVKGLLAGYRGEIPASPNLRYRKTPPMAKASAGFSYSFHQSIWARSSSADRGDRSAGATSKTVRQPVRPLCFMRYTARAKATMAEAVNSGLESSRRL